MAKIKVVAGDLDKGTWDLSAMMGQAIMLRHSTQKHPWKGEQYNFKTDVQSVELLDENNVKKVAGAAGWGLAGAALLGPLGAIGGIMLGGNKREVAFACYMHDGRKFMATTDGKSWTKISAIMFGKT